jgi:hypothetical protein
MEDTAKNPTLAEIAAKHNVKTVFEISVPDDENKIVTAYFRKPTRQILSRALSMQERDPLNAKEIVLRNCYLEGDLSIMDDDEMFISACTVVDEIMTYRKATLKKN